MVTVTAASSHDAGNYTCLAVNDYGYDNRSVSVDVIMPPTAILVSRLTATSVTLVWKNFEHSRAYKLTYVVLSSPSNQSVDRHHGVDLLYYMRSYTFAELQPNTRYRFCICVKPTSGSNDVISGDKDGCRSLWTIDCVQVTTLTARDINVGLTNVRRYVISGCAVVVGMVLLVCVLSTRRRCSRGIDWPSEWNDGGSSGRLSPTMYADSSADCDDQGVSGRATLGVLTGEVYENMVATSSSFTSIFNATDLDEIRRTAVLKSSNDDN